MANAPKSIRQSAHSLSAAMNPVRVLASRSLGADWWTLLPVCLGRTHNHPPADPAAAELLLRFIESAHALRDGFMRVFRPAGFTEHNFIVLVVLSAIAPEPSTSSRLAVHASITRASMTQVLDCLERRRWIERHRDPADRRSIRVSLTPAGQNAVVEAAWLYVRLAADLVRPLPPADLAAFGRIGDRLRTAGHRLPGNLRAKFGSANRDHS